MNKRSFQSFNQWTLKICDRWIGLGGGGEGCCEEDGLPGKTSRVLRAWYVKCKRSKYTIQCCYGHYVTTNHQS